MADGRDGLASRLSGLLLTAGALSALTVFLGRLWARSYFSVFRLPTDDLTLDVQDYAFRTKEIIIMLLVVALVAGGVAAARQRLSPDTWAEVEPWVLRAGVVSAVAWLAWLVTTTAVGARWLDPYWRILSPGLGVVFGVYLAAVLVGTVLVGDGTRSSRVLGLGLVALAVWLLLMPSAVARLAEAAARSDIAEGNFPQAIIEFREAAPSAIRSGQDPVRSQRVYVLLSTPQRMGVAFPFKCSTFEAQAPSSPDRDLAAPSPVCHSLSFDRKDVLAIRVIAGSASWNDSPSRAAEIPLDAMPADGGELVVYDEVFDLGDARRINASRLRRCRQLGSGTLPSVVGGVWVKLLASQGGRVTFPSAPGFFAFFFPDTTGTCAWALSSDGGGPPMRLSSGDNLLILLGTPDLESVRPETVRISFEQWRFLAGDCELRRPSGVAEETGAEGTTAAPGAAEFACGARRDGEGRVLIHGDFRLAQPSQLGVALGIGPPDPEVEASCDEIEPPAVFTSGLELSAGRCEVDPGGQTLTQFYGLEEQLGAGVWRVTVCGWDVLGFRVSAVPVAEAGPASDAGESRGSMARPAVQAEVAAGTPQCE